MSVLANSMRQLGLVGCAGYVGAKLQADPELTNQLARAIIPEQLLGAILRPAASAATAVAGSTSEMAQSQVAALAATVQMLETTVHLLRQQQSGGRSGAKLLLVAGCVGGGGLALRLIYKDWWARLGWATPQQLQDQLASLREELVARVNRLLQTMQERFKCVDESLAETGDNVKALRAEMNEGMQGVHDGMSALDRRLSPMETDVRRAAHGVGLLCEVVSGLSSDASPELKRRLEDFTGSDTTLTRPASNSLPLRPRSELMPPMASRSESSSGLIKAILHPTQRLEVLQH